MEMGMRVEVEVGRERLGCIHCPLSQHVKLVGSGGENRFINRERMHSGHYVVVVVLQSDGQDGTVTNGSDPSRVNDGANA